MIARKLAIMQSLDRTAEFCSKEREAFEELPVFNEAADRLGVLVKEIRVLNALLDTNTVGYTAAKNDSKLALLAVIMPVIRKVQAYASIENDEVLQSAVNYSRTKLIRMRENMLGDACRKVLKLCNKLMPKLTAYGLTTPMLEEAKLAIVDFETKLVGRPLYKGEQKAARQRMEQCMSEAKQLVKTRLDKLVEIRKESEPSLYVRYKDCRKPVRPGSRKLSVRGRVIESDTMQGIAGVLITVSRTDMPSKRREGIMEQPVVVVQKLTAVGGGIRIKSLEAGSYVISTSKKGYMDAAMSFYINDCERTDVVVEMDRLME